MNIVNMNINDLIEYENNPRFNDNAVEPVARSIEQFGFKVPIVVDSNNVIITGHTRLKAAKFLGLDEVPVIVADDMDEDQVKAFRLADNKVGELATWDFEMLSVELEDIELDMSDFGFIETDILDIPEEDEYKEYEDKSDSLEETFEVIVSCEDEMQLQETYEKLSGEGYKCRVLTL